MESSRPPAEAIRRLRERLERDLREQAEQLDRIEQSLLSLRAHHRRLEEFVREQVDLLERPHESALTLDEPAGHGRGSGAGGFRLAPETLREVRSPAVASPALVEAAPFHPGDGSEQKLLEDARRFARLLVSEIELYNREKVIEGRTHRDLYERLHSVIERSRRLYDERFGNTPAKAFDYFHQELVKGLAHNDPSLLGSGYPGPSA
jgi:hypothetical protein